MSLDFYPISYRIGLFYCSLVFLYGSAIMFGLYFSLSTVLLLLWNLILLYLSGKKLGQIHFAYKKFILFIILALTIGFINGLQKRYRGHINSHYLQGAFRIEKIHYREKNIMVTYKKRWKKIHIFLPVRENILKILQNCSSFEGKIMLYKNKNHSKTYYGSITRIYDTKALNTLQKFILYIQNKIQYNFPKNYPLIMGLILGEKRYLSKDSILSSMGLAHLTAVSGLHMQSVFNLSFFIMRMIFISWPIIGHWIAYIFALLSLFLLLMLSNFSPSATRSFLMHFLYIMAKIFHLPHEKFIVWSLVFLIMTLFDGTLVEHPSFLMSFFAVLALYIASSNPIKNGRIFSLLNSQILINSFIIPVSITFFHSFNLLSLLWNILFLNVFSYMVIGGIIGCFLTPVATIFDYLLKWLMDLLEFFNKLSIHLQFINLKQWNKIILFAFLPLLLTVHRVYSLNLLKISIMTLSFIICHWIVGHTINISI
jgi:competence protein ComEC